MNGESSVHIDRGHWLYRFALDAGNIAIYRARRAGQSLAPAEVWRCLAVLGVSDAFVVPVQGSWQPFIELGDGRHRWALEKRPTLEEAQVAARHFLGSLADAVSNAAQAQGPLGEKDPDVNVKALRAPAPPPAPGEDAATDAILAKARSTREASGWELIYSRQRVLR
ncbi:MAG: hypothetical protein ACLQVK_09050 [Acidimicrobiales bacterium]